MVELLDKLLSGEIRTRRRKNVVQARSFEEMLEQSLARYQNRAIEAAQVIEELIELAREMREANARGEALGLNEERSPSTVPWKPTTAPSRSSATTPSEPSRGSSWPPFAPT